MRSGRERKYIPPRLKSCSNNVWIESGNIKCRRLIRRVIYEVRMFREYQYSLTSTAPNMLSSVHCECCVYPRNVSLSINQFECILLWSSLSNGFIMALMWPTNQLLYSFYLQGVFKCCLLMHFCVLLLMECLWMFMHLFFKNILKKWKILNIWLFSAVNDGWIKSHLVIFSRYLDIYTTV